MTDDDRLRDLLRAASEHVRAGDPLSAIHGVRRQVNRRRLLRRGIASGTAVGVAAVAIVVAGGGGHASQVPTVGRPLPPYHLTGALQSFNGCNDYLDYVRARALQLVGPYGLQSDFPFAVDQRISGTLASNAGSAAKDAPAPAPSPLAHSGTTDQVAGVDEPDTVKTDGRIVVTVNGATLRVLDLHARVLGTLQLSGDLGGGLLLDGSQAVVLSGATEPPSFEYRALPRTTIPAQVAVIDLSNPRAPRLLHTFQFDGSLVATRFVGGEVRLVLRSDGPRVAFENPSTAGTEQLAKAANQRIIENSTLDDWLPGWQLVRTDGSTTPRQHLATCDAVARPQHASGISTVSVLSLNPRSSAPSPAVSVVAAGDTVYATADHLYLAGAISNSFASVGSADQHTWIYDFATTGADRPAFVGAGEVFGWLLNSYSMDQDEHGFLRVATTAHNERGVTTSRITVLSPSRHSLVTAGVVANLGRGQQIRAVRFLGDSAYVVTFQSFDPLYVVDLRKPAHPKLSGQLEQPGFSEFLYPLPNRRLLGVGVVLGRYNEPSGLLVAVYDVADPAHPRRLTAAPLANGIFAAGGYDPHAFLYWQPASLAVLSVPNLYGEATAAAAYRIGQGGTLRRLATFAHPVSGCGVSKQGRRLECSPSGTLVPDRTAVIGPNVWAFTPGGVLVAPLAHLSTAAWHPY